MTPTLDLDRLQVGMRVTSDQGRNPHVITARCPVAIHHRCSSGVMLRVDPRVPGSAGLNAWVCASVFTLEER